MAADILQDNVALVTAAGSGMGQRSCVRMADEGAHVVVTDVDEPSAKATADEIKAAGGSAEAIKLAVQDLDGLRADRTACAAWPAVFEHGLHAPPAVSAIWHAPSSEGVV